MVSNHIMLLLSVSLFSMGIICSSYYTFLTFFINFYIVRRLRVCWCLYYNSKVVLTQDKHFPDQLRKELKVYGFFICVSSFCYFIPVIIRECKQIGDIQTFCNLPIIPSEFSKVDKAYLDLIQGNSQIFVITLLIWTGIFSLKKLTESETSYLCSVNNLTLGYGTAIWYYKNYLYKILPENFLMRVRQFESIEGIRMPHKLYILYPKSCKVKQYIDNTEYIEFSKDLPPYEIDHGGIVGRKYSVSVYRIKYNGEFFRCALEYAQPLKTLLALKENRRISLSEMYIERESFLNNLMLLLRDHKDSFEACELVEYDDETEELHEILSSLPSVQAFKRLTEE